ncbi:MAG TPA: carboxy terminal-processing peptidase, partial [Thermodesulfovibrionales bacterium]|nr:carboxy terminal-processing peptidase [Thermodesulfovibrionales bacterium]
ETPEPKTEEVKKSSPERLQKTAREKVLKSYDETLSRMLKEKQSDYFERYFSAVAKALDPHSEYMAPVEKEDFDIGMKGSLEGIGAMLREEDGYVKIESVIPGGPAARQGRLHASDRILKVAEGSGEPVDIVGMKVRDAVKLIRGKKGTEVRLTVRKEDGTQSVVPIVRDVVQIEETFAKGTTLRDGKTEKVFGYITLPAFYRDFENTRNGGRGRNSTDDVRSELKKLQAEHVEGLILDLRNNGGGALTDAIGIAGLFVGGGPVVQVKSGKGDIKVLADEDVRPSFNGPLVVLVNKFSASASEILSGVLQDYGRAVIVGGSHTFGKGTVQTLIDLDETVSFENAFKYRSFGALRITIQKFYRATGESTQYKGIVPDIVLPDPLDSGKIGEEFLEYALPWDRIKPASFEKWPQTFGDVSALKAKSAERVRTKSDFVAIRLASDKAGEQQKKTLQSLNIDVVRKEREEVHKLKEKLGKNSGQLHDGERKKPAEGEMTAEERRKAWVKETGEDPYVLEAVDVLKDMVSEAQKTDIAREAHVLSHSTTQSAIPAP